MFHVMEEPNFIVKAHANSPQPNWLWCTLLTAHQQYICSVSSRNFQIPISVPLLAHLHCFLPPSLPQMLLPSLLPSIVALYPEKQKHFSLSIPSPAAAFPFPPILLVFMKEGKRLWGGDIKTCILGQIGFTPLTCPNSEANRVTKIYYLPDQATHRTIYPSPFSQQCRPVQISCLLFLGNMALSLQPSVSISKSVCSVWDLLTGSMWV